MEPAPLVNKLASYIHNDRGKQARLASLLNYSPSKFSKCLNGGINWKPTRDEIEKICDYLGLSTAVKMDLLREADYLVTGYRLDDRPIHSKNNLLSKLTIFDKLSLLYEWKQIHLYAQELFMQVRIVKDTIDDFVKEPNYEFKTRIISAWNQGCQNKVKALTEEYNRLEKIREEISVMDIYYFITGRRFVYGYLSKFETDGEPAVNGLARVIDEFWIRLERLLWTANQKILDLTDSLKADLM